MNHSQRPEISKILFFSLGKSCLVSNNNVVNFSAAENILGGIFSLNVSSSPFLEQKEPFVCFDRKFGSHPLTRRPRFLGRNSNPRISVGRWRKNSLKNLWIVLSINCDESGKQHLLFDYYEGRLIHLFSPSLKNCARKEREEDWKRKGSNRARY